MPDDFNLSSTETIIRSPADPRRRDARLRRLDPEQGRGLAALHAAPELALGGDDEVPVEGIGMNFDLDPLAAASDHGKDRARRRHDPTSFCCSRGMYFSAAASSRE